MLHAPKTTTTLLLRIGNSIIAPKTTTTKVVGMRRMRRKPGKCPSLSSGPT